MALLAIAVAVAASAGQAQAQRGKAPEVDGRVAHLDNERDCFQVPPERVLSPLDDDGAKLPVEVRVLVDARDLKVAERSFEVTKGVFARVGIEMRVSYDAVARMPDFGSEAHRTVLLAYAKSRYGGKRPAGTDAVYFMTHAWAGGFADCIGGVADPTRAFAIGSVDYAMEDVVPAPTVDEGHIAAHELGHLFGAHHHYSNCAEAQPAAALRGEPGPCTLMNPLAMAISGSIATLERSYIRSYVREYARG